MLHTYLHEEVDNWPVAAVADCLQVNSLSGALLLFPAEDVLIEMVLQLLIGYIDAHLLKAVVVEVLKAKDV